MVIRLYTEDKNREVIKQIVGTYFDGYSLIPCVGVWKGAEENGLIIEVVASQLQFPRKACQKIGKAIKRKNKQEAVLMTVVMEDETIIL
jgi:hypothetical protein